MCEQDGDRTAAQIARMWDPRCGSTVATNDAWLLRTRSRRTREEGPGRLERHPIALVPASGSGVLVPVVADEVLLATDSEQPDVLERLGFRAVGEPTCGHLRLRTELPVDVGVLVDRLRGEGVAARHNVMQGLAGRMKGGNSPEPTTDPDLETACAQEGDGDGVLVVVLDTGIWEGACDRTDGLEQAAPTPQDVDPLDVAIWPPAPGVGTGGDGRLDLGAGHGTFVGGVVRQVSPRAEVVHRRVLDTDGFASEFEVAEAILALVGLFEEWKGRGVLNLSFGTDAIDPDDPAPVLRCALEQLPDDVLVVAAAGNDGEERELYPAAFDQVTAVASVSARSDEQLRGSPWSRHGCWVDASTVGEGIRSTFVRGYETDGSEGPQPNPYDDEPDAFEGPDPVALWTGTSFAAPQVAGFFANHLSQDASNGRASALAALRAAAEPVDGYGDALVLLPGTAPPAE